MRRRFVSAVALVATAALLSGCIFHHWHDHDRGRGNAYGHDKSKRGGGGGGGRR